MQGNIHNVFAVYLFRSNPILLWTTGIKVKQMHNPFKIWVILTQITPLEQLDPEVQPYIPLIFQENEYTFTVLVFVVASCWSVSTWWKLQNVSPFPPLICKVSLLSEACTNGMEIKCVAWKFSCERQANANRCKFVQITAKPKFVQNSPTHWETLVSIWGLMRRNWD